MRDRYYFFSLEDCSVCLIQLRIDRFFFEYWHVREREKDVERLFDGTPLKESIFDTTC